jgi:uncharacterized protein YecE (DUF72 family)
MLAPRAYDAGVAPGTLYAGASGFSYPTWRPAFYPADARPADFLRLYAERLPALELNATGRRLPDEGQLERWAAATPPAFRFAVKLTTWIPARPDAAGRFCAAVHALGERLGPVLVQLPPLGRHDGDLLARLLAAVDPRLRYAVEPKDAAWRRDAIAAALTGLDACLVGDLDAPASFRYLRLRDPPYDDRALHELARRLADSTGSGADAYAFFRHEEEPTAPAYARRLLELAA